ncbi:hypothetical protein B0H15DRAFT_824103 [Mycena belliarum]|uniref:Uncharacterized protein n=1 Tax=Mycena belliarum TaxID=1033014 RepID=A0AAD6XRK0_9AGAR|nr:hypothetical protein B0H15DRAFT_824103 [Mycena belliae]
MGASSSKATRSLPKRVTTPAWSGARASRPADPVAASESKKEVIHQDSKDPQFLSNLGRLGPVRVDHHMHAVRPVRQVIGRRCSLRQFAFFNQAVLANHMFNSRLQSETEAASSTPTLNRIHAARLSHLLDERKSIRTTRDVEFLAQRFGVELGKLDAIAKFLSTPSVAQASVVRLSTRDGDNRQIMKAVWMEPRLKNSPM